MEAAIEKSTDAGGTLALPKFQTKFQTEVTIQNSAAVEISSDNNSSDDELSDDISSDPLADLADESDPLSDESSLEVFQSRRSVAADMAHQRSGLRARVVGKSSPAFFPIQPVWHTGNNIAEGSKNPALFCLPAGSSPDSVHGSCTAIRTNLSTAWLRYQPRISHLRVRQGYDLASLIIEKLEEAERQNILAKMDIIAEMPLGKRLSRRYKLLQHEPKELREVRTTSDTLYDFRVEATNIRGLFLVASNNVTEVNTGLKTLVEKSYDGGENPRIGPEGILVVRTWYSGIKLRGLEIQDAISGQRATIGSNQEIKD
ncbi:MAG: hypothetical protein Q9186_000378 [Xanthomendoza sp. 1 TL-2023]